MKACSNFLCFIPCWAFSTNICHDTKDLLTLSFDKAHDQLCSTVHYALLHGDVQISYELKIRLLNDREEKDEETNTFYQKKNESELLFDEKKWQEEVSESGKAPTFKGLPNPPFYRELTRRILLLTRWHYKCTNLNVSSNSNLSENMEKNGSCRIGYKTLIDSEDLGLTENKNPLNLYYFPQLSQKKTCPSSASKWLQSIQEEGIMELLGMRRTVGTKPLCLPPSKEELQRVSRKPHGSDTNKRTKTLKKKRDQPLLSVAARARSKHFHRGKKDQFFGQLQGNTNTKNEAADDIIGEMIHDAVWINIHTFGGISSYVLEIRVINGYGARWSAEWDENIPFNVSNVIFRGFLEPQMKDGFEKKWRH